MSGAWLCCGSTSTTCSTTTASTGTCGGTCAEVAPLSPLMRALYLQALEERLAALRLFYTRFMDDWVILAPTRHKLRKAIKLVNQTLTGRKVDKHSDKTLIGRIERGFDFSGYHFSPRGLNLASRPSNDSEHIWPGFTSKVRTRSASGNTRAAGGVGPTPA